MQDVKRLGDLDGGHIFAGENDSAVPEIPSIAPGAALEAFQRLLEEFSDALSTTKRDQQRAARSVHTGAQTGGARTRGLQELKGSGLYSKSSSCEQT